MSKYYYDIHGLLSFSIEGEEAKVKHLCEQCDFFRSDRKLENVDLQIKIGPFVSIVDRKAVYRIINRKYCVGENVIFAKDRYKTAHWKLQLENLNEKCTTFYFDGNSWTKYILHKSFVEVLIRYKLNQKGYFMVHSSSVAIDGAGVVFPASPEAGKTSTVLNYMEKGNSFMSDDFSLLGDEKLFAYPTPITLHSHNLKRHPFLTEVLSQKDKNEILWRTIVLKATLGQGDISYKVDIWNKFKGAEVPRSVPLRKMVLLTKYSGETVKLNELEKIEFVEKLLIVNYYETVLFNAYLQAYDFVNLHHKEDAFWEKMRSNIDGMLPDEKYYEILLPQHYSKKEFSEFERLIVKIPDIKLGNVRRGEKRGGTAYP